MKKTSNFKIISLGILLSLGFISYSCQKEEYIKPNPTSPSISKNIGIGETKNNADMQQETQKFSTLSNVIK